MDQNNYNQNQYDQNQQYAQQNRYAQPAQYGQQNQYAQPAQYAQQNQYAQPAQYGQQNQYAQPAQYGQQNQYAQPAQYGQQNQYAQPAQYGQQNQYTQPVQYVQNQYIQNQYNGQVSRPTNMLATNFSLAKFFFLGIVTFGIYPIVIMSKVSSYINLIASRYDGRSTMHYCLVFFIFSWLTCGILPIIWYHKTSNRIGSELRRRGINYNFGAGTFWLWNILGSMIVCGPFIYTHKLLTSMNLLAADYNARG